MNNTVAFEGASTPLKLVLTMRFVLELALLAGVAALMLRVVPGGWRWPAAIGAFVVVAVCWGLFLSPKAAIPLPTAAGFALEAVLFVGTGAGLFLSGITVATVIGAACWLINRILLATLPG
jgi:hypothetical protein